MSKEETAASIDRVTQERLVAILEDARWRTAQNTKIVEDTFDWLMLHIQRQDEQINSLFRCCFHLIEMVSKDCRDVSVKPARPEPKASRKQRRKISK